MIAPVPEGTPTTLYKYRQFDADGYHLRLLEEGELWFSSVRAFNDPFDSVLTFETEGTPAWKKRRWAENFLQRETPRLGHRERGRVARERLRKIARDPEHFDWVKAQHVESVCRTLGVYCLSEVRDDLLMWAHYSASHSGFCVGLDTERLR